MRAVPRVAACTACVLRVQRLPSSPELPGGPLGSRAPLAHACLRSVEGARWASWDTSDCSYEALGGPRLAQQWSTVTFGPVGAAWARLSAAPQWSVATHATVLY